MAAAGRRNVNWTAERIAQSGAKLGLIYSLALPVTVLRQPAERRAVIGAVAHAGCDSIWLKVENFGDDATGEKMAAYIEACRDFHERGLPVVGDHIGGSTGLGALAFGAVGGIAHGVTVQQNFKAASWRRPPPCGDKGSWGASWGVYIPQLDLLLRPKRAEQPLETSLRIKAMCGCRDTHCCPHGNRDMLQYPARHAIYQRARGIERLSGVPQSVRAGQYLNEGLRRVSDAVAQVAAMPGLNDELLKALRNKQQAMGRLRPTMAHLAEAAGPGSISMIPPRRAARKPS
jgi:hypothetical protein